MYIFEGHDYKQDVAVLRDILDASKAVELVGDISAGQSKCLKILQFLAQ